MISPVKKFRGCKKTWGLCRTFESIECPSRMARARNFFNFSVPPSCRFEIKLIILWTCRDRERAMAVHLCLQQIMLEGHQFLTLLKMQWSWYVTHFERHHQSWHGGLGKSLRDIWVSWVRPQNLYTKFVLERHMSHLFFSFDRWLSTMSSPNKP